MNQEQLNNTLNSSSSPADFNNGTGGGSISASMVSRSAFVARHTTQGGIRLFGQDTGTADDNNLIDQPISSSCSVSKNAACGSKRRKR
ncbi:MAG TPA: hypothetical protein VKA31_00390 [Mariprofundaceae bacterium]|nr:hypothetical protein [Mariprofundaceae bacterium]HKJ61912.1 hypothetical protein [Hyphomicrobiales bacterium]